jgi:PGF-CTERM protein
MAILLLSLVILVPLSNAQDLLIENKVTSPDNKTIWKTGSGIPNKGMVTVSVKNQLTLPRQPVDVVLAIDGSASLEKKGDQSTDPKKLRITAAQNFVENSLDKQIGDRAGVVHWNDSIVGKPLELSSNFGDVKRYIEQSGSDGDTNLELALNASWSLLKNAQTMNPASRKVIIVFTDGKDTKSTPAAIERVAKGIKASGIEIYPLSLGSSDDNTLRMLGTPIYAKSALDLSQKFNEISSKIFASVSNVEVKYLIPEGLQFSGESEPVDRPYPKNGNIITWKIGSMLPGDSRQLTFNLASKETGTYDLPQAPMSQVTYKRVDRASPSTATIPTDTIKVIEPAEFYYSGTGEGDTVYGDIYENYKIAISKDIVPPELGEPGCQNVVICIKTPKIDYKPVVVFALDSSGSMMMCKNYATPMMQGVGNAVLSHPDMEYARVDWDNQGAKDFNLPTEISLNPLGSGIDYSGRFRLGSTWPDEIRNVPMFISETEGTSYGTGLNEALKRISDKKDSYINNPFMLRTTAWQVVFITGMSEFTGEDINGLISSARSKGINVSTIGINIGPSTPTAEEAADLEAMAIGTFGDRIVDLNLNVNPNAGAIQGITNNILSHHVAKLYSTPVIKNINVTETLYKYLRVLDSSPKYSYRTNNSDGTTTLYFDLSDMLQNNESCIKIFTDLNFDKLPVDVSSNENKPKLDFNAKSAPPSVVKYDTDLTTKKWDEISLPEGNLSIRCGRPCDPCVKLEPVDEKNASKNIPVDERPSTTTSTPGFEALFAAIGLSLAGYLGRRRMH